VDLLGLQSSRPGVMNCLQLVSAAQLVDAATCAAASQEEARLVFESLPR
jgi:hypothetical protein